jgi:hypothetical protein
MCIVLRSFFPAQRPHIESIPPRRRDATGAAFFPDSLQAMRDQRPEDDAAMAYSHPGRVPMQGGPTSKGTP